MNEFKKQMKRNYSLNLIRAEHLCTRCKEHFDRIKKEPFNLVGVALYMPSKSPKSLEDFNPVDIAQTIVNTFIKERNKESLCLE